MITGRLPHARERERAAAASATAAKAVTASRTTRAMPNRSPSEAAICDAPKKPMALIAKAMLKPVGDRPNSSV